MENDSVSTYQTEEEQVEAIKKWWKENGKSVVGGIALGLAVVGGGKGWLEYQRIQAENASANFENFSQAALVGNLETAVQRGEALIREYKGSTYALFTALELARLQYQAGDKDKAKARLQWVLDNSSRDAISQLAKIRMARLLLDMKNFDAAAELAANPADDAYLGEFLSIQGDVKLARGDREAARTAFAQALEKGVSNPTLISMKLTELGG
ncbi:MAG TPA: tetratricopeptide repeat protein [Thiolapillus brandeum]|uniref:Ancillary SecYEG translocon subunit n=1 Tax=Thiolapillus brandeum TaxID=1076588 RepID=A0A831WE44_9GAMM|nr:tetratricopeptide repeat protein [Thiolapillus brandeum]